MKTLQEQLELYRHYHTQKSNKLTHYIGIPALVLALLILLSWFTIGIATKWFISFAWLAVIGTLIYYYKLNIKLAAVMTLILLILVLIATAIAFPAPTKFSLILFLILLIGGLALQLIGHTFETPQPPLLKTLELALVAPLVLLVELIEALNLQQHFNLPIVVDRTVLDIKVNNKSKTPLDQDENNKL